jgi:hypothetical protein
MKLLMKVAHVEFGENGIQVQLNICNPLGEKTYQGWATIPAADVNQFAPGEIYEISLSIVGAAKPRAGVAV